MPSVLSAKLMPSWYFGSTPSLTAVSAFCMALCRFAATESPSAFSWA